MDALTDVVQLLRPKTVLMGSMVAYGDWGVQVPPQSGPMLYFIMEGSAQFRASHGETTSLETGDFILSGNPTADTFFSRPDQEIVFSDEEFKALNTVDGELGSARLGRKLRRVLLAGAYSAIQRMPTCYQSCCPRLSMSALKRESEPVSATSSLTYVMKRPTPGLEVISFCRGFWRSCLSKRCGAKPRHFQTPECCVAFPIPSLLGPSATFIQTSAAAGRSPS